MLSHDGNPYTLSADWADYMLKRVKEEKQQSAQSAAILVAQKQEEIGKINIRLQKAMDSFLDGILDRNDYTVEKRHGY